MDSISPVSGPAGLGVTGPQERDLQSEFLELLITQMRNQDPLSPMDSSGMMQQLATFSQLEQLQEINANLGDIGVYQQSFNNTMLMNLVGRRVTVLGDGVTIEAGEPSRTVVRTLGPGVAAAQVRDEAGRVVRTIENVPLKGGYSEIEWDGKGDDGEPLPDGEYTISVSALGVEGNFQEVAVFESGIVDSIQFDNGFNSILVNGRLVLPSNIVEVGMGAQPVTVISGEDDDPEEGGPGQPEPLHAPRIANP